MDEKMSNKYSITGTDDDMVLTLHIPVMSSLNISFIVFNVTRTNKIYSIMPLHCRDNLKNYSYFPKKEFESNKLFFCDFQKFLNVMIEYLNVSSWDYCSEIVLKTTEFLNNYKEMRNV